MTKTCIECIHFDICRFRYLLVGLIDVLKKVITSERRKAFRDWISTFAEFCDHYEE